MKYICQVCSYVYDEEKEGVLFKDLPDDWVCPMCGAPKDLFAAEIKEEININEKVEEVEDLKELSPLLLAAIFSNLARGSLKQYKAKEETKFRELANYFTEISKDKDGNLKDLIEEDLNFYKILFAEADKYNDRGSKRALVWGEKVTKIINSILTRYEKEGASFLINNKIYVCSICGFVYIGDTLPKICPVCKVPNDKFVLINGR